MPLAQCNETLLNYNRKANIEALRHEIDESQYCAHDPSGRGDSCKGDSGGPLQTTQTHSSPVKIVGVVSFGVGCGIGLPGLYTRVAHYIDWIGAYVWPNGAIRTPRVFDTDNENDADYNKTNDTALITAIARSNSYFFFPTKSCSSRD